MTVLHEENMHYNLVIPKNSKLAVDGGLDHQRNEHVKSQFVDKINDKKEDLNKDNLKSLQKKIQDLENECCSLKEENKKLKKALKSKEAEDEAEDAETLLRYKNSGSSRQGPQIPNENKRKLTESPKKVADNKRKKADFACNVCERKFVAENSLSTHKKTHELKENCSKCDDKFLTKKELSSHIERDHKKSFAGANKDYNCNDCFLQFENSLQLKKHAERTMHTPNEHDEKCFTCEKLFPSYRQLMNHRKSEHPSNKKCRYFLQDQCKFNENVCWYSHEKNTKSEADVSSSENACNECDANFTSKKELMKHKKLVHKQNIQKCRKYLQGNCAFEEQICWFSHEIVQQNKEKETEQQVFWEEKDTTPPDQIENIYAIIARLSQQVEQMMKNPQNMSQ